MRESGLGVSASCPRPPGGLIFCDDTSPVIRLRGATQHVAFAREGTGIVYMKRTGDGPWHKKVFQEGDRCCGVVLRLDDAGHAYLAWSSGHSLVYATNESGAWRVRSWLSEDGYLGDPSMAIGGDQVPRLLYRDGRYLFFVKLTDPTASRLPTEAVAFHDDDGLGSSEFWGAQLVTKGKRPIVTWSGDFVEGRVFVAHLSHGKWKVQVVDSDGDDSSPAVLIADDGTLHLAFAERNAGIWYTHGVDQ